EVDSSEIAFKIAASQALQEATKRAKPSPLSFGLIFSQT
ncbi:unnamed protein product, partial [marine sediment metagenome]